MHYPLDSDGPREARPDALWRLGEIVPEILARYGIRSTGMAEGTHAERLPGSGTVWAACADSQDRHLEEAVGCW